MINLFGSNSTSAKISKLESAVNDLKNTKVDKITGKGLSTYDFTAAYKAKLDSMDDEIIDPVAPSTVDASDDYVTPQMFGAKANGYTDDTDAIQKAIESGKSVFFPLGEYMTTKPIVIDTKSFWNLHAEDATIIYEGDGYAFRILNAMHCRIDLGVIFAQNGGGVEFYSDSQQSWSQYVALIFSYISAKTDCIHIETADKGWSNENQVYGGRFGGGENGVNIVSRSHHTINGWKFYNCGIEGVTNGFMFDATEDEETAICNMVIANCRYGESFETILKTKGLVFDCLWSAPSHITPEIVKCSEMTTRFEIAAPIGDYWRLEYNRAWHRGCIMDGKLMGERPTYEIVK